MKGKKIKILWGLVMVISLLVWGGGTGYAQVTGRCDNCHTMHNSQNGISMNYDTDITVPIGVLLRGDCKGCHFDTDPDLHLQAVSSAPVVYNDPAPNYGTNGLAAGNFQYCEDDGESVYGHNVKQISTADDTHHAAKGPPGFIEATKPATFTQGGSNWGPATWTGSQQAGSGATTKLTCAGEFGCHGDRSTGYDDYDGISGAHHTVDTTIDMETVGTSYRFLAGIKGLEDDDWELDALPGEHNGYYGVADQGDNNTISYLCGQCHGNYHAHADLGDDAEVGATSSWLRHPTDVALAASGGSSFTTDYVTYSPETPVAYTSPSLTETVVNASSIVMCLSCHRAHASPELDILRFTYSDMSAGDTVNDGGCERCHERQR